MNWLNLMRYTKFSKMSWVKVLIEDLRFYNRRMFRLIHLISALRLCSGCTDAGGAVNVS